MTETRWTLDAIAAPETMGRPEGQVKPQEVQSRGGQDAKARGEAGRRRTWKRVLWIAGLALVVVASTAAWKSVSAKETQAYAPVRVARADLQHSITATGTLQAVNTVDVGTQVSGTISALFADYNSPVKKGQVIAQIDPSQVQAQLDQARASYQSALASVQSAQNGVTAAQANVLSSQANLNRITIALNQAKQMLDLTQSMIAQGVSAKNDLIAVQSTYDQALAQVEQAKAQLAQVKAQEQASQAQLLQSKAQLQQSQAQVENATVNLSRTTISAPIDGVVVARNVNVGQTVAASLQAPTLFLLAQDLTKMQVLANIDEADVGQLRTGEKVSFTVDAYPNSKFNGKISQIRLAPLVTQNVVTYTAVVEVANPDLKLYPGMTANITATTAERNGVIAVPNAALRFQPAEASAQGERPNRVAAANASPNAGSAGNRTGRPALAEGESIGRVYKVAGENLVPVRLVLGLTDGVNTEVVKGDLAEGDQIAVAAVAGSATTVSNRSASPFTPQAPNRVRGVR